MERDVTMFDVEEAMAGRGDWFSAQLLRLIAKADGENRERIRSGFPFHVAAYERWLLNGYTPTQEAS